MGAYHGQIIVKEQRAATHFGTSCPGNTLEKLLHGTEDFFPTT